MQSFSLEKKIIYLKNGNIFKSLLIYGRYFNINIKEPSQTKHIACQLKL